MSLAAPLPKVFRFQIISFGFLFLRHVCCTGFLSCFLWNCKPELLCVFASSIVLHCRCQDVFMEILMSPLTQHSLLTTENSVPANCHYVLPKANLHRICARGCAACCPTYWARELVELSQYCALIALVREFETGGWLEDSLLQCAQLMQIKHFNFHEQEVDATRDGDCAYINYIL